MIEIINADVVERDFMALKMTGPRVGQLIINYASWEGRARLYDIKYNVKLL